MKDSLYTTGVNAVHGKDIVRLSFFEAFPAPNGQLMENHVAVVVFNFDMARQLAHLLTAILDTDSAKQTVILPN